MGKIAFGADQKRRVPFHDLLRMNSYLLAELSHAGGSVALAELRAVLSQDEGAVRILGPRELERIQDKALPQRIGQVLLSTYNMRDTHLRIVNCKGTDADSEHGFWKIISSRTH